MIPGEDAAPDAMAASLRVMDALDLPIDWDHMPVGAELALNRGGKLTDAC